MRKILGLDLGSGSIGWSVVTTSTKPGEVDILADGSRVISYDGNSLLDFNAGKACTLNQTRTVKRTMRKMNERRKLRRKLLSDFLRKHDMFPEQEMDMPKMELWKLRADAAREQVPLKDLGRVLLQLCHKRGYNASKADLDEDAKTQREYIAGVRNNYDNIRRSGKTMGAYFYDMLKENPDYRVKGKEHVLPRQAYVEEFDAIMRCQRQFYPDVLSDENIAHLRDYILFYQRPLKSCKHLVKVCEFEQRTIERDGKKMTVGPKVAHRSNPYFQLSRVWQDVNKLSLENAKDPKKVLTPTLEQKREMVHRLMTAKNLSKTDINKILFGKSKNVEWKMPDWLGKGIAGNSTVRKISEALEGTGYELVFDPKAEEIVDTATGEVKYVLASEAEGGNYVEGKKLRLYPLWHLLYSVSDMDALKKTLRERYEIEDEEVLDKLASIDFSKEEYGNMSEKALRRILPYLMEGHVYSKACELAGFRHSQSLTKEENESRELKKALVSLKKGDLRQPIVEKVLNQMVKVVNALQKKYDKFDEIHIELARELRMTRDERATATKNINANEKENKRIAEILKNEYGLTATRGLITKYKLWEESGHKCMYCGSSVSATDFLRGYDVEVEHVVPRALLFDDSYSNKVCACRKCNQEKGKTCAYDFMKSKSAEEFESYQARVNEMCEAKTISRTKRDRLLTSAAEIPQDFVSRQLRESQYIARKALEMLHTICRDVVVTTGSVTAYVRHLWGWNDVTHDLNLPVYEKAGKTTVDKDGKVRIAEWDKRRDHRHHAIDALAIAFTSRSIIERLNNLSGLEGHEFISFHEQGTAKSRKQSLLEKYILSCPHPTTAQVREAIAGIAISRDSKSKLASSTKNRYIHSRSKNKKEQEGVLVPRGPLHEETVYGKIRQYDDKGNLVEKVVVKYPLSSIKTLKDASFIVDGHIRRLVEERLKSTGGKANAFDEPLYSDKEGRKEIRTVRCFTGLQNIVTVKRDADGREIGFAKPGGNHHVAIYENAKGELVENIATFFHAFERKAKGLEAVITDPAATWEGILREPEKYDQRFLAQLPAADLKFRFSMQIDEMFILGMERADVELAIREGDYKTLLAHLYRVQKLSSKDYSFASHTETVVSQGKSNNPDRRFVRIQSTGKLLKENPIKVKVSLIGEIEIAE